MFTQIVKPPQMIKRITTTKVSVMFMRVLMCLLTHLPKNLLNMIMASIEASELGTTSCQVSLDPQCTVKYKVFCEIFKYIQ